MRSNFERALRQSGVVDISSTAGFNVVMYMSYWYGSLYVVMEAWRSNELADQEIDALLTSPHVDLLRRYRNATFHFQDEYLHEKFTDFIFEGDDSATWVRRVHAAFSRYFESEYGTMPEWREGLAGA